MSAVARDFDLLSRVFAALAAVLLIIRDGAAARWMRTFLLLSICHDD
jgi:hypothetical protein